MKITLRIACWVDILKNSSDTEKFKMDVKIYSYMMNLETGAKNDNYCESRKL